MKKSKSITLALITAALASCNQPIKEKERQKTYMRSDSTASYSRCHHHGNGWLWYYAFRPYGYHNGVGYNHIGYHSSGISSNSNIGSNFKKTSHSSGSSHTRGGFGRSGFHVSA